jgi:hypothetical protein
MYFIHIFKFIIEINKKKYNFVIFKNKIKKLSFLLFYHKCLDSCPPSYFNKTKICYKCSKNCLQCFNFTECNIC